MGIFDVGFYENKMQRQNTIATVEIGSSTCDGEIFKSLDCTWFDDESPSGVALFSLTENEDSLRDAWLEPFDGEEGRTATVLALRDSNALCILSVFSSKRCFKRICCCSIVSSMK